MLINAQRAEELRVAIVEGALLDEYQVAVAEAGLIRGNVYRGVVASLHTSLNAAFIEFGEARHGFLKADDVVPQAYHRPVEEGNRHPRVDRILERGRPVIVQVTKDPSGDKGAGLTTNISLAGRYLVLMPFSDMRGISRKLEDEGTRRDLRELVDKLEVSDSCGFIVRTAALDQNKTALNRDLNALQRLWKRIRTEATHGRGSRLLYSDQDLIIQAVRDYLDSSIDEVLVDDDDAFEKAKAAMRAFMPRAKTRLIRYRDRLPLFSRFQLEPQIEATFQRTVTLPSGGSIVIEGTEALTAIDVNSGRSKGGSTQEETVYLTNLEAATEAARQLRLRDIGGLIVVDLIDMRSSKHQRQVEKTVREAVKADRARISVGRISDNGLLEINRQRLKTPLVLRTHRICPTCGGGGRIPSPETVSLNLMRRIEERAAVGRTGGVRVRLHPELADAFQNQYRQHLAALEREFEIRVEIIAATNLHRSEEEIEWLAAPTRSETPAPATPEAAAAVRVEDLTTEGGRARTERGGDGDRGGGEADGSEGDTGKRKRRRGGRRRRKSSAETAVAEGAAAEQEPTAPHANAAEPTPASHGSADEHAHGGDTAGSSGSGPSKRRRSGRRRRKSGGEATDAEGATAEQASTASDANAEPVPAGRGGADGQLNGADAEGGSDSAPSKRRRRRRRSPRKKNSGEEGGGGGTDNAGGGGDSGQE